MAVYDCFSFMNEMDLLELKLNELNDVVDKFVLVEATMTHSGLPKRLYFAENVGRFWDFHDKIIHIIVDNMPSTYDEVQAAISPQDRVWLATGYQLGDNWVRERFQRNQIMRGLTSCKPDDIIIIEDADEIVKASILEHIEETIVDGSNAATQTLNTYYMNWQCTNFFWAGSKILKYKFVTNPSEHRFHTPASAIIPNAGWHYNYIGGVESIKIKLRSFAHDEYAIPEVLDNLESRLNAKKDALGRTYEYIQIEMNETNTPKYVLDNPEKFRKYMYVPNPDEHILIMDEPTCLFSLDDLKKLEDAGIQTVYGNCFICWDKIYKQGSSELDWSSSDSKIEKYLHTGLKLLLPTYYTMPDWFPAEWYIKNDVIPDHRIPNYGNIDFRNAVDNFINQILIHYADIRDRIQLIYSIPSGGEFVIDPFIEDNFPFSDDDIIGFVVGRQKLFVKQHGEIWMSFHNWLGAARGWNGVHLPILYKVLMDLFPNVPKYSIQFAHFAVGAYSTTNLECQSMVTSYKEKYGIEFFVGSQYCDGLLPNLDAAIKQKVRGYFTAPFHGENPSKPTSLEPWMLVNMMYANRMFQEAHGYNSF